MAKWGVIADDLTGASDAGITFATRGFQTSVYLSEEGSSRQFTAEVAVADTDSRALKSTEAYQKVSRVAEEMKQAGVERIYKKVDSTLRGNLGAEIDAILDHMDYEFAFVAPAFPALGRTTKHGMHYVRQKPLHETEFARDPKNPMKSSSLTTILASQTRRKMGLLDQSILDGSEEAITHFLLKMKEDQIAILVCDAETDSDLLDLVRKVEPLGFRTLWVGSAGLTIPLAESWNTGREAKKQPISFQPVDGPVMLVSGSLSPVTKQQLEVYTSRPSVRSVEIQPIALMREESRQSELARCREELEAALKSGRDVSLSVAPCQLNPVEDSTVLFAETISSALGTVTAEVVEKVSVQGLILTGGDTAKAVCKSLGITELQLIQELETGIPLSRAPEKDRLFVVTKAGGFGQESSLWNARNLLKGEMTDV
ncbi:four-carbon acid sugar kinase family protein [Ammoniphilus sp. YIM 78166]|uniref:four-carbon acid sugar kinase family protein n=1 Tax=Ammoniphilus sp. YIM 78166 TaxID=1644106 RepID=UPI00106F646A|nr:four-carbon acid sugar kinase family protein [Ammoniphilus sp. YIM 78166]